MREIANYLAAHDSALAPIISASPLPDFTPHTNYYSELVDSIISQQLSVKAAASIEKRFTDLFGGELPSPTLILTKTVEELRSTGLSRPKAGYMQDLATKVLDGTVHFETLDGLSNDDVIKELTTVKGVGEWTAHMFLMFCMGRLDILPIGDLGIRNGVKNLYNLDHVPTPDEVTTIATTHHWHPYESVASWYIWRSLGNKPAL